MRRLCCGETKGRGPRVLLRVALVGLLGLLGLLGCAPAGSGSSPSHLTTSAPDTTKAPADPATAPPAGNLADREVWDVVCIEGVKIGYARTRIRRVQRDGQPVTRIEWFSRLTVQRSGEQNELEIRLASHQTPEGRLLDFESEMNLGPTPMRTRGRVEGDQLVMETTSAGKTRAVSIPWSSDTLGFYGVEQSLLARPIQPGQRRSISTLIPMLNQVATVELVAGTVEPVKLPDETRRLLRIDSQTRVPGANVMKATLWADPSGEVLKTADMGQETYRATKAEAMDETGKGQFDLGSNLAVPVDRPLANPHATRRVRYRVSLADDDPAGVFVTGASQKVTPVDPHTAEITVYALRPDAPTAGAPSVSDPPTSDDLQPNSMIQSDDPAIVAMSKRMIGDAKDVWSKAVALERGVHDFVDEKNFSQAFATAAEVAQTHEGDCTEHAVLLAALARAAGLPARAAIGLVYMKSTQSFGYHMWTEVYLGDRWIPLDATLGQGGVGAAHLTLTHTNFKDAGGLSPFLPVAQVMGRMKIEVLEVE
ncbi:MAG: lasso peptide biosynthesis protein [Planctomycetia bacterium]|nr:lasso peptide biosynthesis protein [Planctomycetia bacterium]